MCVYTHTRLSLCVDMYVYIYVHDLSEQLDIEVLLLQLLHLASMRKTALAEEGTARATILEMPCLLGLSADLVSPVSILYKPLQEAIASPMRPSAQPTY